MGEVYLAEHELLKRPCAVKLIRPEVVLRAGTIDRFRTRSEDQRDTLAPEHGRDLRLRPDRGRDVLLCDGIPAGDEPGGPCRAVWPTASRACRVPAAASGPGAPRAHDAGLIHRDIKPSNIFAARRGGMDDVAKVLDFGLVRPAAASSSRADSDEGQILGTPLYMSPEQATNSLPLDVRSDIYSLGAVAYFLLTGRPPFDVENAIEAIIAHARDPVVPPAQIREDVPADLDAVVLRCLAKDPMERFPDAESLEIALGRCTCASSWDKTMARQWWNELTPIR